MNIYHGYTKIIGVIPPVEVGNPIKNAEIIGKCIEKYSLHKPSCIVFPELSITGYTCGDLFTTQSLQKQTEDAINIVLSYAKNIDAIHSSIYVVGAPLYIENGLYNVAIVFSKQGILGIVPKRYLANDHEFYEKRWFVNNTQLFSLKTYLPKFQYQQISFGTNLVFQPENGCDFIFGVEICRDLWVTDSPSHELVKAGATVIANISASNETEGKQEYRRNLVRMQSAKQHSVYLYVNASPQESTTDTVYSGHSLIAENGEILAETTPFTWRENSIIADVDLELIKHTRIRMNQQENVHIPVHYIFYNKDVETVKPAYLCRSIKKYPFLKEDEKDNEIQFKEIFNIQVSALRKRLLSVKPSDISLGISGGADSTLTFLVLHECLTNIKNLKIDYAPKIHLVYLEGYGSTEHSYLRAKDLVNSLGYELKRMSILYTTLEILKEMQHNPFNINISSINKGKILKEKIKLLAKEDNNLNDIVFENIQARIRTNILMSLGFMLGTSDLSELALGFSTYGGDHSSMYNVNCGIPKTLVRELLLYIKKKYKYFDTYDFLCKTIDEIYSSNISPELIPGQDTEKILGNYSIHDFILYHFLKHGFSKEKILYIAKFANWYEDSYDMRKDVFVKHLDIFFERFYNQQYKRSFMPDGPKVLDISLSPRTDWRMPSDLSI